MKEKIEEISLSMERGHRRVLRVLSALAVIGLQVRPALQIRHGALPQ